MALKATKSQFNWKDYKVYVHGPGAFLYMKMFHEMGLTGTGNIDDADIVCFTGGEDVNPKQYSEKNVMINGRGISSFNDTRDEIDLRTFGYCLAMGKLMVGICRGGQLLNVANGGRMWQHVNGHAGGPHDLIDTITGQVVKVSSTHHQMMRPAPEAITLAVAREAAFKVADCDEWHIEHDAKTRKDDLDDVEVCWYSESRSLCFQPHPEFGNVPECRDYFFSLLKGFIT